MATEFVFDGETIIIPGTRSRLVSGVKNAPAQLAYGIGLYIDTGGNPEFTSVNYGGGAGIAGQGAQDKKSFYEFTSDKDFRNFVGGGLPYLLAQPLFQPAGFGIQGLSKLIYVRAFETTKSQLQITFNGDGSASVSSFLNGGILSLECKYEGLAGNGVMNPANTNLCQGFGVRMVAGVDDTSKFILKFYRGTYTGEDQNGFPLNGIAKNDAIPTLLVSSPEFNNVQELVTWMTNDSEFNGYFELDGSTINGDGSVDAYDLLDFPQFALFLGGIQTTSQQYLDQVLEYAKDMLFTFIICDKFGDQAQHINNFRIVTFANTEHPFKPEVYIASQSTKTGFATSKADAAFYDNENVTVVHGGSRISNKYAALGYRSYPAIYTAAAAMGREAGKAPQIPLTLKNIKVSGLEHEPSDKEVVQALKAGVLIFRLDGGRFVCVKGINSLQNNQNLLNEDNTTHSKQLRRITRQLNMELIVNSKKDLLEQENGVNRNTLSGADLQTWTNGYLKSKTAKTQTDNLILSQKNIVVTRVQDKYDVEYEVEINTEVSFIFFTGKIVDL